MPPEPVVVEPGVVGTIGIVVGKVPVVGANVVYGSFE